MTRLLSLLFALALLSGCAQLQTVDAGITITGDDVDVRVGDAPPIDPFQDKGSDFNVNDAGPRFP